MAQQRQQRYGNQECGHADFAVGDSVIRDNSTHTNFPPDTPLPNCKSHLMWRVNYSFSNGKFLAPYKAISLLKPA